MTAERSRAPADSDTRPTLHLSVVSHGQAHLVHRMFETAARFLRADRLRATLTMNLPQPLPFDPDGLPFPVHVIRNDRPLGYGANHNQAFRRLHDGDKPRFFCALNPDLEFVCDPFDMLTGDLRENPRLGVIAPRVVNERGDEEDSARELPTPLGMLAKALFGARGTYPRATGGLLEPDWIAGMFLLFPSEIFELVGGFDERYFLYYEDVDLCCRLRLRGYPCAVDTRVSVVHRAQRASRRSVRHLAWHMSSMGRFFGSELFRRCRRLRSSGRPSNV
jgi:N-acetylglucosaminyl-diphospho-decaprenol L-rhamnosyltransferase